MNKKIVSITEVKPEETIGNKVRQLAEKIERETQIQIKATSRILGAAAQMSENHDRLINEVVDMVKEDLEEETQSTQTTFYTVDSLKQKYKTLNQAKAHFGIKANSWASFTDKLNQRHHSKKNQNNLYKSLVLERFDLLEKEIKKIKVDMNRILSLLNQIILSKK